MALIEVTLNRPQFVQLIELVLTSAPIPVPTFVALGPTRLVSDLRWGEVSLVAELAGVPSEPGKIFAQALVVIGHVSVEELRLDPGALGATTSATAWLSLSAVPGRVQVDLVAMLFPNRAPDIFSPAVSIGRESLPLPSQVKATAAAVVAAQTTVTLRFATKSGDDLLAIASDPEMEGGNWRIRVSGEFFAENVSDALNKGLAALPAGTEIEDPISSIWTQVPFTNQWAAVSSVGLKKIDACPGLFGSVDVSVTIGAILAVDPHVDDKTLGLNLRISTDASDWDSFRCWAGTAGVASSALSWILTPVVGVAFAIGSGILVGEIVRTSAHAAVEGLDAGSPFVQTASDSTSTSFGATLPLPELPQSVGTATIGADGLVVTGTIVLASAVQTPVFDPNGGELAGVWRSGVDCGSGQWGTEFLLPSIKVADSASVLGMLRVQVPVSIFPTSVVEPTDKWRLDVLTTTEPIQYVTVASLAPSAGDTGSLYLHTSAGIRRFDIPPLSASPPVPDALAISLEVFNCRLWPEFISERVKMGWLVDPPVAGNVERGDPLRQWLLTFEQLSAGSGITVHETGDGQTVENILRDFTAEADGEVSMEIITGAQIQLGLNLRLVRGRTGVRLVQRWLLPLASFDLARPAIALTRHGRDLFALTGDRLFKIDVAGNKWSAISSQQRGLLSANGMLYLFGDGDIEVLKGTGLQKLSAQPFHGSVLRENLPMLAAVDSLHVERIAKAGRDQNQRLLALQTPLSVRMSRHQFAVAYENQIIVVTPDKANVRADYVSAVS